MTSSAHDSKSRRTEEAQPLVGQRSKETQPYGTITHYKLGIGEAVRRECCEALNPILADTITLRDLYKKHHWQVSGPTFYQLHLLFDKHAKEQTELIDLIAERIQTLGGIAVALSADVAELSSIERAPKGREEVPVQLSRLLEAHEHILIEARALARRASELGDEGTNDILISEVVRTNEMQVWFVTPHLVDTPLVREGG